MAVYINRTLNLKKIQLIGFDMDYTLVDYDTRAFEKMTHRFALERLISAFGYPESIRNLPFDYDRAIVGLVIDKRNGYLLQLSRYNKVKAAYFGLEEVPYKIRNQIYQNKAVELRDPDYQSLDTSFAISHGVLFSQLVQLKKEGTILPEYHRLEQEVRGAIDQLHRDDTIKSELRKNFSTYVIQDPRVALMLERFKEYKKKLMIITNSDYAYTRELLDYALNPFFKHHSSWMEVFDLVITFADKPKFFEQENRFLRIDPKTGAMSNHNETVKTGIYQGGNSRKLQQDLGLHGDDILYIGDHIYGDVVSIKKSCNWRTALVLSDLRHELEGLRASHAIQVEIDELMDRKSLLERRINDLEIELHAAHKSTFTAEMHSMYQETDELNTRISELLSRYKSFFNPYWGEILRAGYEESRYAEQMERYACIYMTRVSDLYDYSPRTYFRPIKRIMPHELETMRGSRAEQEER